MLAEESLRRLRRIAGLVSQTARELKDLESAAIPGNLDLKARGHLSAAGVSVEMAIKLLSVSARREVKPDGHPAIDQAAGLLR